MLAQPLLCISILRNTAADKLLCSVSECSMHMPYGFHPSISLQSNPYVHVAHVSALQCCSCSCFTCCIFCCTIMQGNILPGTYYLMKEILQVTDISSIEWNACEMGCTGWPPITQKNEQQHHKDDCCSKCGGSRYKTVMGRLVPVRVREFCR